MSYADNLESFCKLVMSGKLSKERDQYGVDAEFGQDVAPRIRKWLDVPEHLREGRPINHRQYSKILVLLKKYQKREVIITAEQKIAEQKTTKRSAVARDAVKQALRDILNEVKEPVLKEDIVKRLQGTYCASTIRTEVSNCNTQGHILAVWKDGERERGRRVMRYWMPDMGIPVGYLPYRYFFAAAAEAPPIEATQRKKTKPEPEVKSHPKRKKTWRLQLLRDCQRLNEEAATYELKAKEIRTKVDVMMGMVLSTNS